MPNYSGNDSKLQIFRESVWGTKVVTTGVALEFLSESLKSEPALIESAALVGAVTTHGVIKGSDKTSGDFSIEVNPLNIGLLMGLMAGTEATASEVEIGVYDHVFTPVSGGTNLEHFTALIDRKSDVFTYTSNKIDSITFECGPDGILTAAITCKGQQEEIGDSLDSLSYSTIDPYVFQNLSLKFGAAGSTPSSTSTDVTNFGFTWSNNLEDHINVSDGTAFSRELDYQKRDMNFNLDVLLSADSNTLRETYFKTGTPLATLATFISGTSIGATETYLIKIEMLNGYIMEDPSFVVAGPERLAGTLNIKASEQDSDDAVSITLRDEQTTKYLS